MAGRADSWDEGRSESGGWLGDSEEDDAGEVGFGVGDEDPEWSVPESGFGDLGGSSGWGVLGVVDCLRICVCVPQRKHIDAGRLRREADRDEDVQAEDVVRSAGRDCSAHNRGIGRASSWTATRQGIVRFLGPNAPQVGVLKFLDCFRQAAPFGQASALELNYCRESFTALMRLCRYRGTTTRMSLIRIGDNSTSTHKKPCNLRIESLVNPYSVGQ